MFTDQFNSPAEIFSRNCGEIGCQPFIYDRFGSYTYHDLYYKISVIIKAIQSITDDRKAIICLYTSNTHYFITGFLAGNILGIPCVIVPQSAKTYELTIIHQEYPDAIWLITNDKQNEVIKNQRLVFLDQLSIDDSEFEINSIPHREATIQFSSGTTTQMKKIIRTNQSLVDESLDIYNTLSIEPSDQIITMLPLSYSFAFGSSFLSSLISQTPLFIYENVLPRVILNRMVEYQIKILLSVPAFYDLMDRFCKKHEYNLEYMKYLICSGAALEERLLKRIHRKFNKEINNQYGSTETGALFFNKKGDNSLGEAFHNIKWDILNNSELVVSGRTFYRELKTNEDLKSYPTGDLVKQKAGNLYFKKRNKKIININSQKVSLEEIQDVLNNLEYVRMSKVMVKGRNKIIAKIMIEQDKNAENVKADLKKMTMDYKIPQKIIIRKIKE